MVVAEADVIPGAKVSGAVELLEMFPQLWRNKDTYWA